MIPASVRRCLPFFTAVLLLLPSAWSQERGRGRKYKPPPPTCKVTVTVLKAEDGKPLPNANVVFQPLNKDNKPQGNMEMKTDDDGKATLDIIPIGDNLLLQVIADGFQTYGKVYALPDNTKAITVHLNHPAPEYSIYQKHPQQNGDNGQGSQGKQPQPKQNPQQ